MQYKNIIEEQVLQIETITVHLSEIKTDFEASILKVKVAYKDLEKSIKGKKFKAWLNGIWQGVIVGAAIIVTVLTL